MKVSWGVRIRVCRVKDHLAVKVQRNVKCEVCVYVGVLCSFRSRLKLLWGLSVVSDFSFQVVAQNRDMPFFFLFERVGRVVMSYGTAFFIIIFMLIYSYILTNFQWLFS